MNAWKVNKLNGSFAVTLDLAHVFFYGDTRVVGHLLPKPGQAVKECGFPRIRWTNQGNQGKADFSFGLRSSRSGAFHRSTKVTQGIRDLLDLLGDVA